MARSLDELVEFLLAEIALCGMRGAGSADFRRFISKFFEHTQQNLPPEGVDRSYYSKVWDWVRRHRDVQIVYRKEPRNLSLSEFEALELQETGANGADYIEEQSNASAEPKKEAATSETSTADRSAFYDSLRQRLLAEGLPLDISASAEQHAGSSVSSETLNEANSTDIRRTNGSASGPLSLPSQLPSEQGTSTDDAHTSANAPVVSQKARRPNPNAPGNRRGPRKVPKGFLMIKPTFDEPSDATTAPRIYVSQNRTWQAVAGHSLDLKKVPSMQFMLLSIIAASGPKGILQPDLVRQSGQDKRSVPHRTDELFKNGYIEKKTVQANKFRTSLCIHRKFLNDKHFLNGPSTTEEVFGDRTLIFSSFVELLHQLLIENPVILQRDLRVKMGVAVELWQSRAIRTALVRLAETGMIYRRRTWKNSARNKKPEDRDELKDSIIFIKLKRPPNEEDLNNLKFRRQADSTTEDKNLEDNDLDEDEGLAFDDTTGEGRIVPQWTPDRSIANLTFEIIDRAGVAGLDNGSIRDRTTGRFWKRPIESYLCRLTDAWEESQPPEFRHKAIIRDTALTMGKRYVHYLYRTYNHFQEVVDSGKTSWAVVSKEAAKKSASEKKGRPKKQQSAIELNEWGFMDVNPSDFQGRTGTATLQECRSAIAPSKRRSTHWDNALTEEIGYEKKKRGRKPAKMSSIVRTPGEILSTEEKLASSEMRRIEKYAMSQAKREGKMEKPKPTEPAKAPKIIQPPREPPLLSIEQRVALGLARRGRLGADVENQIREHRAKTGDPTAIPDVITKNTGPRSPSTSTHEEEVLQPEGDSQLDKEFEHFDPQQLNAEQPAKKSRRKTAEPLGKTLFTMEFRKKHNLPLKGRLKQSVIEHYRSLIEEEEASVSTQTNPEQGDGKEPPNLATPPVELHVAVESVPFANHSEVENEVHERSLPKKHNDLDQPQLPVVATTKRKHDDDSLANENAKRIRVTPDAQVLVNQADASRSAESSAGLTTKRSQDTNTLNTPLSVLSQPTEGIVGAADVASGSHSSPQIVDGAEISQGPECTTSATQDPQAILPESAVGSPSLVSTPGEAIAEESPQVSNSREAASTFEQRVQEIIRSFTTREKPGLYINPFATRAIPRGRPKKALMAIFKFPQLQTFDWFISNPSISSNRSEPSTPKSKRTKEIRGQWKKSKRTPRKQLTASLESTPDVETPVSGTPVPGTPVLGTPVPGTPVPVLTVPDTPVSEMPVLDTPVPETPVSETPVVMSIEPRNELSGPAETEERVQTSEGQDEPVSAEIQSIPTPTPSSWVAINASAPVQTTPQQSSHTTLEIEGGVATQSPKPAIDTLPASNIEGQKTPGTLTPAVPTPATEAPTAETPAAIEDDNNLSVIAETDTHAYSRNRRAADLSRRGVVLGRGTVWQKRTSLIKRILNLCGGVFPFNGEVAPPFFTLWKEAYPDAAVPDRTTLTKTINNMIDDPEHKIRKFSFRVPTPSGASAEKFIIAFKDIAPTDPKIKELRRNMIKEHPRKHYPDPIKEHLGSWVADERLSRRKKLPAIEDIALSELIPGTARKLRDRIKNTKRARKEEQLQKKQQQDEIRTRINAAADHRSKVSIDIAGAERPRRQRLDTLNREARSFLSTVHLTRGRPLLPMTRDTQRAKSPARSDASDDIPLANLRPQNFQRTALLATGVDKEVQELSAGSEFESENVSSPGADQEPQAEGQSSPECDSKPFMHAFLTPMVFFNPSNGTFSTDFDVSKPAERARKGSHRGVKRVRIADPSNDQPRKRQYRRRINTKFSAIQERNIRSRVDPTLVDRLTGLTGDPKGRAWTPRKRGSERKPWTRAKPMSEYKERAPKKSTGLPGQAERFKKVICTLVIASCMAGEEGAIDWNIVTKVYESDKRFDLQKTKNLWAWAQKNMPAQIQKLSESFQSKFLAAYEAGQCESIEDPATHDWAALVRWALRNCDYPEPPIPKSKDALSDFLIIESDHEAFDRVAFNSRVLSSVARAQRLLRYAYGLPLHNSNGQKPKVDDDLRARSWIRANTATPQAGYNGKAAHDKLSTLNTPTLEHAVDDLLNQGIIKAKKLKRLLPGRNYDFPASHALRYRRTFELDDFMDARDGKKKLDEVFANEDPEKRVASVSRTALNGAVMALLSLVSEGQVRLVPHLPPVNNTLRAPAPRISVWGFREGDYTHRRIDRACFFWNIDIVPTSTYQFGNPLNPSDTPMSEPNVGPWLPLKEPPLPGKNDLKAPLPIWSTIEGNAVIWPWWYRLLNVVLQAMMFQPEVSAAEIQRHCVDCAAERFEVDLVLQWLVSIGAASQSETGFTMKNNAWAVFGEQLLDRGNDWFGEHVKRKKNVEFRQSWKLLWKPEQPEGEPEDPDSGADEIQIPKFRIIAEENRLQRPHRVDSLRQDRSKGKGKAKAKGKGKGKGKAKASDKATPKSDTELPGSAVQPIQPTDAGGDTEMVDADDRPSGEDVAMTDANTNDDLDAEGEVDLDAEGEVDPDADGDYDLDAEGEDDPDAEGEIDDEMY
ncbi:hypothetical protein BU24DRAFT_453945 [Aaosphaeria arxii CBS 175.79]|uniref:Uncharacterized protein n=1 Tax=Aaosphaeria arxii CBS 175.79 TaxID=1450172 RepID=A0A6A5XEP6_9PLEO|nr:uncharacterized protein BU24DRAFT_453945 [Aaosphaeria arxii CBS 175.79]KAF2011383.1 hypothetical protein BU24DRAFT_453945 [Aaosphaeria arxii CBS 175.79]